MAVSAERHAEAMDKIASLVSVRERCVSEVSSRLTKCGFSAEEVNEALDAALRCGIVDETRYAKAYIRGKTASGWGREKICARLRAAGVADEVIAACSEDAFDEDAELSRALRELARRPSHSSNPYASLMRRLSGKGYPYDIANRAVKQFLADEG